MYHVTDVTHMYMCTHMHMYTHTHTHSPLRHSADIKGHSFVVGTETGQVLAIPPQVSAHLCGEVVCSVVKIIHHK